LREGGHGPSTFFEAMLFFLIKYFDFDNLLSMEYLLPKDLFLFHFQKNEENSDLKIFYHLFERRSAVLRASRIQISPLT